MGKQEGFFSGDRRRPMTARGFVFVLVSGELQRRDGTTNVIAEGFSVLPIL
jgi:hypothetical protein